MIVPEAINVRPEEQGRMRLTTPSGVDIVFRPVFWVWAVAVR